MSTKLERFLQLTDIAEEVYESSEDLDEADKASFLKTLEWEREKAPQVPARSLEQLQSQFMTQWNEGIGRDVERFWDRVEQSDIDLRRRDRVREVLTAGKIGSPDLFFDLEDHFAYFEESDKLDDAEVDRLARLMDEFEKASENHYLFGGPADSPAEAERTPAEIELDLVHSQIVEIDPGRYRFDYWGMQRYEELHERGFQGGGYSWAGIAHGLLEMHAPELRALVGFNPEGDCLCVHASDVATLQKLAELISDALESDTLLDAAIERALERGSIE